MLSSAVNTLRVLEYLVEKGQAGVSEMARGCGLAVATIHRIATTLVATGYVQQHPKTKLYQPTSKILSLAQQMRSHVGAHDIAHAHLADLVAVTNETANIGILEQNVVWYVDIVRSDHHMSVDVRTDAPAPAYATASGKVLLAFRTREQQTDYLSRLAAGAIAVDPAAPPRDLREQWRVARERGYAEKDDEHFPDIYCVAAPIFGVAETPIAAISLSAPLSRSVDNRDYFIKCILHAAETLSKALRLVGARDWPRVLERSGGIRSHASDRATTGRQE